MAIKFVNAKAKSFFEGYITVKNLGLPTECPECNSDIEVQENGQVRCVNSLCKKKVIHKYINFYKSLEIDSAGEAFCKAAADEGNTVHWLLSQAVNNPIHYVKWAGGINGDKVSAGLRTKLAQPITAAKYFSLFDLEGFGEKKLDKVEDLLRQILDGKTVNATELASKEGWAESSAKSFCELFLDTKQDIMNCKSFFNFEVAAAVTGGKLAGKSFCFTGKAEAVDGGRKACEKLVKDNGGTIASGVSKTLSYLVTDDTESGSSKNVKAKQLGIPVLTSFQFLDLLR